MCPIIPFAPQEGSELQARLQELRSILEELDRREPADMESEAYDLWAQEHEDLEDEIDEILDQLDL